VEAARFRASLGCHPESMGPWEPCSIASGLEIVRSVINLLRIYGAEPYIIPAMGIHGGATPPFQGRRASKLSGLEPVDIIDAVAVMGSPF
jgi:hypothetical protein